MWNDLLVASTSTRVKESFVQDWLTNHFSCWSWSTCPYLTNTTHSWISPGAWRKNRERAIIAHQLKFPSSCWRLNWKRGGKSERFNCISCWRKSATRFQIINHWGNLVDPLKMDWLRPQTEICHKSPQTSSASPLVGVKIILTKVSELIFLPGSSRLFLWLCIFLLSYQEAFVDIIEEDEIAEHGDETQKPKSSHNVDHNIFQIELSLNCFG